MVLALTTGNKIGLGLTAAVFIAFALASTFVIPRYHPDFPGGGLRLFIVLTTLLFGAMMAAVFVFGREEEEPPTEEPAAEESALPAAPAPDWTARLLL